MLNPARRPTAAPAVSSINTLKQAWQGRVSVALVSACRGAALSALLHVSTGNFPAAPLPTSVSYAALVLNPRVDVSQNHEVLESLPGLVARLYFPLGKPSCGHCLGSCVLPDCIACLVPLPCYLRGVTNKEQLQVYCRNHDDTELCILLRAKRLQTPNHAASSDLLPSM